MALIKCPECKGQVSDTAESCPHCGYIISKSKGLKNSFIANMLAAVTNVVSLIGILVEDIIYWHLFRLLGQLVSNAIVHLGQMKVMTFNIIKT